MATKRQKKGKADTGSKVEIWWRSYPMLDCVEPVEVVGETDKFVQVQFGSGVVRRVAKNTINDGACLGDSYHRTRIDAICAAVDRFKKKVAEHDREAAKYRRRAEAMAALAHSDENQSKAFWDDDE